SLGRIGRCSGVAAPGPIGPGEVSNIGGDRPPEARVSEQFRKKRKPAWFAALHAIMKVIRSPLPQDSVSRRVVIHVVGGHRPAGAAMKQGTATAFFGNRETCELG